jgi:hypothetical protein
VPARALFEQSRVLRRDSLDDLDEAGVLAERVAVELTHMRAGTEGHVSEAQKRHSSGRAYFSTQRRNHQYAIVRVPARMNTSLLPLTNASPKKPAPETTSGLLRYLHARSACRGLAEGAKRTGKSRSSSDASGSRP